MGASGPVRRVMTNCGRFCGGTGFARCISGTVSLGRIIGAGGYLIRISGCNSGLLVASYVSGLLGNTMNRTIRGVGVVFNLSRATNLGLGPSTF